MITSNSQAALTKDVSPVVEGGESLPFQKSEVEELSPWDGNLEENLEQDAKIFVVDDEPLNIKVVCKYLKTAGYSNFADTNDARQAIPMLHLEQPDMVLLDIMMPEVNGLEILKYIRNSSDLKTTPVIILTAVDDRDVKAQALKLGANDFLTKPVDSTELIARTRNVLAVKAYQDHLKNYADELEYQVQLRTAELADSRMEVIHCLGRAAEYRDNETGRHVIRVGRYVGIIARELGIDEKSVELMEQAAPLHDVGKIGIPDSILLKPGKLEPEEFEFMQKHCGFGRDIVKRMSGDEWRTFVVHTSVGAKIMNATCSPVLKMASSIALTHHEKWDGSGYPLGLVGEDIPIEGRITAVADVFDALSSKRPYKPPFPLEKCFSIMEEGRGSHFDPTVLDSFFARRDEILRIQIEYADVE